MGSSVSDTIKTCIAMGNERAALKVKSEFKVLKKTLEHMDLFNLHCILMFLTVLFLHRFLIRGGTGLKHVL